ncbi:MAG: membrane protein insertion efficiency factor YidD [Candidatus Omnitrophota bacterium]|nr:membrane protein insertion efficiency factor YidD [Candidatus Omnitrophota bacterium]
MFTKISVGLIKVYQAHIRGWLPDSCRFSPSCSEYSRQAIEKYGFWKGSWKGLKRIVTCHPFSGKYGFDPLE